MPVFSESMPVWIRQVDTLPEDCAGALSSDICDGYEIASAVLGHGSQLPENSGLIAFSYLWRRFGPPWHGSDDHKDLAGYVLSTPHPSIFLSIFPSASPLEYGVGYLITNSLSEELCVPMRAWETAFESWWLVTRAGPDDKHTLIAGEGMTPAQRDTLSNHFWNDRTTSTVVQEAEKAIGPYPRHLRKGGDATVCDAIRATLEELLRPVFIRDVAINILGKVADDALEGEEAERSIYAGYGVPKEAMDALAEEDNVARNRTDVLE